ncbi:MAG: TonB-dependent receptor [Parvularculaceae bacterium]
MTFKTLSARAALIAGVSAIALGTAPAAVAQESTGLDVVIVTAQKREENQQEVPISVETLSGDRFAAIQAAGDDILALAARVPSLYAESSNGRLAPRFYIRGLGNVDFDVAASQPVSIVMDDVVMENVVLKSSPIFDIQQIEVSRGPQGTLFGRNTPAGVVKFTTAKPTNEFSAFGQFSYGRYDTITAQGGIGGPLIADKLSVRVSGLYQHRSDWIDNAYTGENNAMGGYEELAGRVQVLFTPTETVSLLLNVHGRDYEGTSAIFRANIFTPGSNELNGNFDRDVVYYDGGDNNPQESDGWGGSAKLDWDLGAVTLTSITGFETASSRSRGDIDGGAIDAMFPGGSFPGFIPFPSDTQDSIDDLDQFTQEIRLASNGDNVFDWQVGFFYFDTDFLVSTFGPGFPPLTTLSHANDSWAVFGQASYDLTEALTVTAGVRYTEDDRDFDAVVLPPAVTVNPTSASDEDFSWDVSALYRVNDGFNLYARVARGFRGPTIQGRDVAFAAFSGAIDPQTVATSETILSWEAGFKSIFLDNRVRLNADAYYYTVDDQQFSIIGGAGNVNQVINADKGVGWGFEADLEAQLTDNFYTAAGFSYNNTEIKDETLATAPCGSGACTVLDPVNGFGQALIDGNPFPNAPELTFNIFAEYTIPFRNDSELFINTDWAIQGKTNLFLYESAEFHTSGNTEGGVRAGMRMHDGRIEVAAFVRNVLDAENVKGAIDFNNLTGFVNEPRIFGGQITVRY